MIKAIYSINGTVTTSYKALKISEDYKKKKPNLIWIDIYLENHELGQEETLLLSESFKFHEMSIEDCLFPQYPKIEEFGNYVFAAVHGIQLKPHYFQEFEDSIYELDVFVGKGFVITLHAEELFFLETLFEKAKARPQIEMKSLENLLYNIFNKVVSSYEFSLDKI
jgi:magnesium transporter